MRAIITKYGSGHNNSTKKNIAIPLRSLPEIA